MTLAPLLLSLQVALPAAFFAGVLGVGAAALLARRRFVGRHVAEALLTAPMVLPPTVLGYYVLVVLGRQSVLGRAYESVTGSPLVFTFAGAVLAASIAAFPLVLRTARASLEAVDPTLIGAARNLGASPWRAWLTVTLPLAAPGIGAGVALGLARALGEFGITLMVAGNIPGETQTAALAIYDAVQAGRDDDAAGLALALAGFSVCLLWVVGTAARAKVVARGATDSEPGGGHG